MAAWLNIFQSEPVEEESSWGPQEQEDEPERSPSPGHREDPLSAGNQSFLNALPGTAEAPIEKSLSIAFKTIYQHLNEEHYIDRLVNALYTKSHMRAAGAPSDHIIFENRIRAQFPTPSKLGSAIQKARDERLHLIESLLSSSIARFRLCALAHLFEAAFALRYDNSVNSVAPRELETEEADYVLKKIQDLFLDLFKVPCVQIDLRQFLGMIYEADKVDEVDDSGAEMLANLLEHAPPIMKKLFPCLEGLTQEFVNLCVVGRYDNAFKSEVRMLFRFVMLSLKDHEFVKAKDYISECRKVIKNLQKSLEKSEFKGPAERLMKIVVGLAEQFWDGGMITEINLAIEQVMTAMIKDAIQYQGHSQHAASAGWDVMKDFSRLLALMNVNVPPVPLPSVVVNRKNWILALDSIILSFPNLLPNNIHLNSTIEYDRATKSIQREWHLKIRGMEVQAQKIAYCLQRRDKSAAYMADIGVANVTIPANSLDMDIKFTVTTPGARKPKAPVSTSRRPSATPAPPPTPTTAQTPGKGRSRSRNRRGEASASSTTENGRGGRHVDSTVLTMVANVVRAGRSAEQKISKEAHRAASAVTQHVKGEDNVDTDWAHASQETIVVGRPRPRYAFSNLPAEAERGNGDSEGDQGAETSSTSQGDGAPASSNQRTSQAVTVEAGKVDESFISLKECTVQLRKVDMNVVASKHPVIQAFAHPFLARQLRKGIEQALVKTLHRVVDAVNESVESIMEREQYLHDSMNNHHHQDDAQARSFPVQAAKTAAMLAFQTQSVRPFPTPGDPAKVEMPTFGQAPWATKG
ncbi:hypothetical protein BG000_001239 [Podila horticola]|nr:hypothetical protein BG000_001239 [Podila horticola]